MSAARRSDPGRWPLAEHLAGGLRADGHHVRVEAVRALPTEALLGADASDPRIAAAVAAVAAAEAVIVASPVYKAAYSGVLKAFLDLPPSALAGKALFTARYWTDLVREAEHGLLDLVTIEDSFSLRSTRDDGSDGRTDQVHDLTAITRGLAPHLQSAGLFRRAYEPGTLRDRLGVTRSANRYAATGSAGSTGVPFPSRNTPLTPDATSKPNSFQATRSRGPGTDRPGRRPGPTVPRCSLSGLT